MNSGPPPDQEVVRCLEEGLGRRDEHAPVVSIERTAYPYATSFPLEEVVAHLADGRVLDLILKDLTWERLLPDARRTKPAFLYDPLRCIQTYENILVGTGVGAACYGTFVDDRRGRYWLLMEKVAGVELWQIGDFATWVAVARWLADFHQAFAGETAALGRRNAHLLRYDSELFRTWPARALQVATQRRVDKGRRRRLAHLAAGYDEVVDRLTAVPPVFVHGEFYPSNVLVGHAGAGGVWPIDWEMSGIGLPLLDLTALIAGWDTPEQAQLVDAYLDELGPAPWRREGAELAVLLDCCRLHYALQWLGWSPDWSPPPEHAHDRMSEVLELGERLGL